MSDAREELCELIAASNPDRMGWLRRAADAILTAGYSKRTPGGEAERGVGRVITLSKADSDTGNAVISPDEPTSGMYWTLIATGGTDEDQNRIGARICDAINAGVSALAATPAGESAGVALDLGPEEISYQVEQDEDGVVAEAHGPEDDARREALHYVTVYGQDGPVSLFRVSRREWRFDAARASQPSTQEADHGG